MNDAVLLAWLIGLSLAVLLNTLMLLRILPLFQGMQEMSQRAADAPRATVGEPALPFRLATVTGGEIALGDFTGRLLVVVFVSPACGSCGRNLLAYEHLAQQAAERGTGTVVLVSDASVDNTVKWATAASGQSVDAFTAPLAVAPRSQSPFLTTYNEKGQTPSFVVINPDGTFGGYDRVGAESWSELCRHLVGDSDAARASAR